MNIQVVQGNSGPSSDSRIHNLLTPSGARECEFRVSLNPWSWTEAVILVERPVITICQGPINKALDAYRSLKCYHVLVGADNPAIFPSSDDNARSLLVLDIPDLTYDPQKIKDAIAALRFDVHLRVSCDAMIEIESPLKVGRLELIGEPCEECGSDFSYYNGGLCLTMSVGAATLANPNMNSAKRILQAAPPNTSVSFTSVPQVTCIRCGLHRTMSSLMCHKISATLGLMAGRMMRAVAATGQDNFSCTGLVGSCMQDGDGTDLAIRALGIDDLLKERGLHRAE